MIRLESIYIYKEKVLMIEAPLKSAFDTITTNQNDLRNKFAQLLIIQPKTMKEYALLMDMSPCTLNSWALHNKNVRINTYIKIASFVDKELEGKRRERAENL